MISVTRPSRNALTGGYSSSHPGYDFSGQGDPLCYAAARGKCIQAVSKYNSSWINGEVNDPTPKKLTTEDYGNYLKYLHDDGSTTLYAHLEPFNPDEFLGKVKEEGAALTRIGHTGNSTGRHLHFEFRDASNRSVQVTFESANPAPQPQAQEVKNTADSELLRFLNVKSVDEAKAIIETHMGASGNGGYLKAARERIAFLETEIERLAADNKVQKEEYFTSLEELKTEHARQIVAVKESERDVCEARFQQFKDSQKEVPKSEPEEVEETLPHQGNGLGRDFSTIIGTLLKILFERKR